MDCFMPAIRRTWREVESSPLTGKLSARPAGKPGDDSIVKENLRRSLPRHFFPDATNNTEAPSMRFSGMAESIGPMWSEENQTLGRDRAASRWSAPGPGKRTRREDHAPSHRPQMSSGRLFLDRVARQHCPSPLHRHEQHNMRSPEGRGDGDISTLLGRGHFYFALTSCRMRLDIVAQ